ncbi:putative nucleotidyltransferase substrate binding domain-containing protein [Propionivibrio sp.]|uniref:putative nucleotidyltransferase substrate binding domain-containing protein n=1 Tax=Propionivibrio sp. TaxID=2212460 RepID=UPI0025CFE9F4|nr:putative nucleotidyltransferase substrate binding domain-containing protein [Propionivibrio sp.]MBK7356741.1 CBS domain-containing protein [Propionivibrio sp.]MBK8401152.1 CBS domain-containing protein [Propionivibrio sp.]MBK8743684.1 CBS domain-containing protein [Propionivibrio sp.]
MNNTTTAMLVSATLEFLRTFPPFDRMEPDALQFLGEHLKLAFYPKGSLIVSPQTGVVRVFRILQRGKVVVRHAGDANVMEHSMLTLGPGEGFSIGSVAGQRPSTSFYMAISDVFCYELQAEDFFALMQMSSVLNIFCTQYLASLLSQSRQQLQIHFSQHIAEQQTMNSSLASIIKQEPIAVMPDTPTRQVVETMVSRKIGSMVVVDAEQQPVGIFTQSDVITRIVLPGVSLDSPIGTIMSPDPITLPIVANAYDAALAMALHGVRHLLAVDEGGRLMGVVSERDLFTLQRVGLRQVRQTIDAATNIDMLLMASQDVRQLSLNMLAQGIGAEQITQFISALNDTLTRRIIEINLDKHDLYGIEWAWLSFGSEGRDEQTFNTDQDNGIIYICTDIMDREQTQLVLIDFARDVNADLDKCGFPFCSGNIMASNPQLCLTLEEWEEKFDNWIRTPEPQALLNATIFFDFRPLYGKYNLADRLRLTLLRRTRSNPLFLRMMAGNALSVVPPLGMFRDFVTDSDPEHPGTIDLKKYGTRLFIDAARVFSLAHNVSATNTVQRIKQSAPSMNISVDEASAAADGFNFIQLMRLRHQHAEQTQGRAGDNLLRPDDLNEVDRRILKEALRQARKLQRRLKLDYQL